VKDKKIKTKQVVEQCILEQRKKISMPGKFHLRLPYNWREDTRYALTHFRENGMNMVWIYKVKKYLLPFKCIAIQSKGIL